MSNIVNLQIVDKNHLNHQIVRKMVSIRQIGVQKKTQFRKLRPLFNLKFLKKFFSRLIFNIITFLIFLLLINKSYFYF